MTAAAVRSWLDRLEQAHQAATPGPWERDGEYPAEVYNGRSGAAERLVADCATADDAAAIVAERNALPALLAAVRAALDLADEDDTRRDDYGYRIRNGLDPSPGDRLRSALSAALDPEEGQK